MDEKRKAENDDLIRRMRDGERLERCSAFETWFPPRPMIQKDPKAIRELSGEFEIMRPADLEIRTDPFADVIPDDHFFPAPGPSIIVNGLTYTKIKAMTSDQLREYLPTMKSFLEGLNHGKIRNPRSQKTVR